MELKILKVIIGGLKGMFKSTITACGMLLLWAVSISIIVLVIGMPFQVGEWVRDYAMVQGLDELWVTISTIASFCGVLMVYSFIYHAFRTMNGR